MYFILPSHFSLHLRTCPIKCINMMTPVHAGAAAHLSLSPQVPSYSSSHTWFYTLSEVPKSYMTNKRLIF